jgi:hypothetical protein
MKEDGAVDRSAVISFRVENILAREAVTRDCVGAVR